MIKTRQKDQATSFCALFFFSVNLFQLIILFHHVIRAASMLVRVMRGRSISNCKYKSSVKKTERYSRRPKTLCSDSTKRNRILVFFSTTRWSNCQMPTGASFYAWDQSGKTAEGVGFRREKIARPIKIKVLIVSWGGNPASQNCLTLLI